MSHHWILWLSPSSPPPPKEEEEGKGGGAAPKYIGREDTSKEKTLIEIERDAGVWRPPGKVISNKKSTIKHKWIHI